MNEKRWILSLLMAAAAVACMDMVNAFVLQTPPTRQPSLFHQPHTSPARRTKRTRTTTTTTSRLFTATSLPDISKMKSSEMREELESYGISTKAFLEKKEFMAALEKARAEGKTPKQQQQQPAETKSSSSSSSTKASSSSSSSSRDEKMKVEMEKAQKMSVGDLRTKLKELGIKTTSFFEKSEFVRAYATAMVDGVKSSHATATAAEQEEEYDASYRDVVVQKMNARDPRLLQGTIIDIKAASSSSSSKR